VAAEGRLLLLADGAECASVVREFALARALRLVRTASAGSAFDQLRRHRFACALFDLDALESPVEEFLTRVRDLAPDLRAVGYARNGRAAGIDLPVLPVPLQRSDLEAALGARRQPGHRIARAAASAFGTPLNDASHEELRRRVGQFTTLYQIARAIGESRNWSEALDYFLATLRDYLGARGAGILLWSRENRVLAPRTVLSLAPHDVDACVRTLLAIDPTSAPHAEIHPLECFVGEAPRGLACAGHDRTWHLTVLPLLYRRSPLGFLLLDKEYAGSEAFLGEIFFLQTVQTILAEEVANAVHLSRLVDLKNFNEAVLDHVESGVVTANEAGEISYANRRARQILGQSAAPGPLGTPEPPGPNDHLDRLFPAVHGGASVRNRILTAPKGTSAFEGELMRRDGQRVPVRLRSSRITNPSDSEPLVVMAFEDLREQRRLESQARRADRLRSLGELSAAIAHEVRNPLQGIALTLANLKEHLLPGAEPYVAVMFSEMERLNALVGGILNFARPVPPQCVPARLAELCERAADLASERAAARQVRIDLDIAACGACEVDPGQILQVILNVLLNAIDASPPGAAVSVRVEPGSTAAGELATDAAWTIAVRDHGGGIADDVRDKLFDPFFTTKPEGTGLGLAVSLQIVEEHGGTIQVESTPGHGATFRIELPARGTTVREGDTTDRGA